MHHFYKVTHSQTHRLSYISTLAFQLKRGKNGRYIDNLGQTSVFLPYFSCIRNTINNSGPKLMKIYRPTNKKGLFCKLLQI